MENIKFEAAMERLEEILKLLEDGDMSLDGALSAYDEAVKLVRVCSARLNEAESRVKMLLKGADGAVSDCPFDATNAN